MTELAPQITKFSDRNREVLTKEGLIIFPVGSQEIATYQEPTKLYVPGTFDQDLEFRLEQMTRFNREFRSRLRIRGSEVFWTEISELADILAGQNPIKGLLEAERMVWVDSCAKVSYQSLASLSYLDGEWRKDSWCDCGYWSGHILLTVRPARKTTTS